MALVTTVDLGLVSSLTSTRGLVTAAAPLSYTKRTSLASGTAAGMADKIWTDTRTLAGSGTEDLDLAGVLVDALGSTVTFVKLKAVMISAAVGNTNNVRVARSASNGVPLFLAASGGLEVVPGGTFLWVAPTLGAITVTPGTGDLLTITNSSSGTSVTYDVVLIGTSA